jgi:hypothetical protein
MDGSLWQQAEDIFHRALELPTDARPAFLDQACGANQAVRREVESLLAHEKDEGSTFAVDSASGSTPVVIDTEWRTRLAR